MAKLKITTGNPDLDGEYELDLTEGYDFTKNEWFLINNRVGVTIADMVPGSKLNMNVMTALGLVVLARADKERLFDAFMATKDSQTVWEWDEAEVEDDALPTQSEPSESSATGSENGTSGPSTNGSSDISQDEIPAVTGSPPSATSSISDRVTSVISPPAN